MGHLYKNYGSIKSNEDAGTISGYFATYDRIPDSYGDVIAPGAFSETLEKRKESGHPFPLCWNHDLDQIIGAVYPENITDTEKGPHIDEGSFFDTPLAQEKRELVKKGVVWQYSFAYDILAAGPTELDEGVKANELQKLDVFEISIVPIPANPRAVVTDIKAGKRNSAKDADAIREAIEANKRSITILQGVLWDVEEAEDPEDGKDDGKANGAPEEPEQSNPKKDNLLAYIKNMEV